MTPYLRVANVYEDRIDLSGVLEMNCTPGEYETYHLIFGDILLNEGQSRELVGRPAMYRDEVSGVCFQNTLLRFRAQDIELGAWALAVFRSYLHNGRFQRVATQSTNIAHLGASRLAVIEFALPPLAEQRRIVAAAERQLAAIERIAVAAAANLRRCEQMREAVLAKAFRGELA